MDKIYSGYSYERFKKPRRIYVYVVIIIIILISTLSANLLFGFFNFNFASNYNSVLPGITFYVTESEEFANKSDAIARSVQIKNDGGSGYLRSVNGILWKVIDDICANEIDSATVYSTAAKAIKISDKNHAQQVETILNTFHITFANLCDYIHRYENGTISQKEIADNARIAYNELIRLTTEFQDIQFKASNPVYSLILIYLTRQLLGLNIIWIEGLSDNFIHILKNAACWVAFAYCDLVNELK